MESILLIAALVSLLVQGLRKLPLTAPLWQRIPDGYRWAPPLVLAFLGTLADRLIAGDALWPTSTVAALSAVAVTWLASMGVAAGAKEMATGKNSEPPALRSGSIALLFFGILLSGCQQTPEPCSADALETQVRTCEAMIATAPTVEEAQADTALCVSSLHAWHARCGGGS